MTKQRPSSTQENLFFSVVQITDVWIKKDGGKDFGDTMGGFDGAEICEVVGIYILHKLGEDYGKERIGLYRDDSLACFENTSGPEAERRRKTFIKLFKNEFSLNIFSETNLKVASFLDLRLNLSTGKYKPYNKPDDKPLYINVNSDHPPNIIKILLESISRRILNCHLIKPSLTILKSYLTTHFPSVDLTIKSSFSHSLKIKIAAAIKTEDERLYGSTPHTAVI